MPAKSKSLVARITAVMKERHFAPSAVAFNTGLSRNKLNGFLSGTSALRSKELDKVLDFLDLATSPVETEQKRWHSFAINTYQFDAISDALVRHSLAYIADGENASGTLVAIGDREFIATTAHTISPSLRSLVLIGHGFHPLKRDDIKIVKAGRAKGGEPDVAYIELEPGTTKRLGRESIGVDRICDAGPGQPGRLSFSTAALTPSLRTSLTTSDARR